MLRNMLGFFFFSLIGTYSSSLQTKTWFLVLVEPTDSRKYAFTPLVPFSLVSRFKFCRALSIRPTVLVLISADLLCSGTDSFPETHYLCRKEFPDKRTTS